MEYVHTVYPNEYDAQAVAIFTQWRLETNHTITRLECRFDAVEWFEIMKSDRTGICGTMRQTRTTLDILVQKTEAESLHVPAILYLSCDRFELYLIPPCQIVECWLGHKQEKFSLQCVLCEDLRCILRDVRQAGLLWLLAKDSCGLHVDAHRAVTLALCSLVRVF